MPCTFTLEDDEALVLFEWLSREIDDRKGVNLARALVVSGEFWALNALQCVMERETLAPFDRDYAQAVREARARLTPAEADTVLHVACGATDSAAIAEKT